MKNNYFKKMFSILLCSLMFFTDLLDTYAEIIDINDVEQKFEELSPYNLEIDSTNKKINVMNNDNQVAFSFTYGDDYIEYENRNGNITEENAIEEGSKNIIFNYLLNALAELAGNNNELNFDNFNPDNVDYDVHGLQVESIPYSFELDIGSIKGQFIKYLKISLDTDKITKLYEDFGPQIGDAIMKLVPELKVSKLTKDSVVITLSLEKLSTDETEYYCDIYRADSEKGEYKKINSELLKCNDIVEFTDSSLKENTTYYYKAKVRDEEFFSEILKVTTKKVEVTNDNTEQKVENPKTGIIYPAVTLTILLGATIIIRKNIVRKNRFSHI